MKRNGFTVAARLIGLVRPMLPTMLLAVFMGVIGFLSAIAIPVLGGYGILAALAHNALTGIVILLIICALLRGVLRYTEQFANHYIAFKLLAFIRDKVFHALRRLTPAKLEGHDKGSLVSLITGDIELLEVFYAHTISPVAIAFLVSLIMIVFIGLIHPLLAGIAALGYLMVGVFLPLLITKLSRKTGAEHREEFANLNTFLLESLRGLREIIQFGAGKRRLEALNAQTDSLAGKTKKLKTYEGLTFALTGTLILMFSFAALFASAVLMQSGAITSSGLVIAVIAMMSSFGPVTALANLANNLAHTFAAGNRVLDILDEEPVTHDVTDGMNAVFEGASCENIGFAYGGEKILRDFSMDFPKNQIIGISGKSGSGKSTILRLLMRFWDVQSGAVRLSGQDVRKLNTRCLRNLESFVTQDTQLFHDSIANNIRIARLDATQEQIEEACKKASLHDFIVSLPKGYDADAGELGGSLSGGERQRIGLARAFLHDAPFLLLDEPTSNLDSLNEAVILKALKDGSNGKTVALVSHRRSTMGIADVVYTVKNGRMS
ncbi:MAG: ABC transporter ATP-binding protein/permease [Oscillospiraceae bacterium]|jgi:ATP-binding cassette subfamily C protein|nr:ABC transporter ATP-binding protein/permease [Oscillospiraceae bacterium]